MKEIYEEIQRLNVTDPASPQDRLVKTFEEVGELAQAVGKDIGRKIHSESKEDIRANILEEGADTIQCVISVLDSYDISFEELCEAMTNKNGKWEQVIAKRKCY